MVQRVSLILLICLVFLNSCAKEETKNQSQIIGEWKLISYSIQTPFDINKDGTSNANLLNEINCVNSEILKFETTSVVTSNETYNPTIEISKSEIDNSYNFNAECPEGVIGFATSFSQISNNTFEFNDRSFTITNDSFKIVIEDEIEIYNEDFTIVLETRDLVLTYSKL